MSRPNSRDFTTPAFYEAQAILAIIGLDPDALTHRADLLEAIGALCTVTGCGKEIRAARMCDTHYRRHHRLLLSIRRNQADAINRKAAA